MPSLPEITITGLTNGEKYNADIYSLSDTGFSARNPTYIQIIPTDTGPNTYDTLFYSGNSPSAPANIISTSKNGAGSISWDAVADDNGILGYLIWYYDTTYHLFTVVNNNINTVNISNLSNGTTYVFRVSAYNVNGIGAMSNIVTIEPAGNSVPCLVSGTEVLTQNGYKRIETLNMGDDMIVTSDGRCVPFNIFKWHIDKTDRNNAPYRILAHSFDKNIPSQDMVLSPLHAFSIGRGRKVWQIPKYAAAMNRGVVQEGIGLACDYYHIMLPNFYTDNLVIQGGNVVESFCGRREKYNVDGIYKFNPRLGGYTRKNPSIFASK